MEDDARLDELRLCRVGRKGRRKGPSKTDLINRLLMIKAPDSIVIAARKTRTKKLLCELIRKYIRQREREQQQSDDLEIKQVDETKEDRDEEEEEEVEGKIERKINPPTTTENIKIKSEEEEEDRWVELKEVDVKECEDILKRLLLGNLIAQGVEGQVIEICGRYDAKEDEEIRAPCSLVLKAGKVGSHEFDREVFFLQYLNKVRVDGGFLTADFRNAWRCKSKVVAIETGWGVQQTKETYDYLILDKWTNNMRQLLREQGYITEHQLWNMFRVAARLGSLKIIHGDLKADNMLYRPKQTVTQWRNQQEIVLTDFGFTGFSEEKMRQENEALWPPRMGWNTNIEPWQCLPGRTPLQGCPTPCSEREQEEYAININVTQLEMWFLRPSKTAIPVWQDVLVGESEDGKGEAETRFLGYFGGIRNLNRHPEVFCKEYTDQYVKDWIQQKIACSYPEREMYQFDLIALTDFENEIEEIPGEISIPPPCGKLTVTFN